MAYGVGVGVGERGVVWRVSRVVESLGGVAVHGTSLWARHSLWPSDDTPKVPVTERKYSAPPLFVACVCVLFERRVSREGWMASDGQGEAQEKEQERGEADRCYYRLFVATH